MILHPLNSLQFKCELNVLLAAALQCATDGQITALGCCNAEENLKTAGFRGRFCRVVCKADLHVGREQ